MKPAGAGYKLAILYHILALQLGTNHVRLWIYFLYAIHRICVLHKAQSLSSGSGLHMLPYNQSSTPMRS